MGLYLVVFGELGKLTTPLKSCRRGWTIAMIS